MAGHEVEHDGRRIAQQIEQTRAMRDTQCVRHRVRHHPHPGVHEPGIATRTPEADLDAFQHHDGGTALGEVQGRRQTREAAPDDHDIGRDIGREHRGLRGRRSRAFPEAVAARIVFQERSICFDLLTRTLSRRGLWRIQVAITSSA